MQAARSQGGDVFLSFDPRAYDGPAQFQTTDRLPPVLIGGGFLGQYSYPSRR